MITIPENFDAVLDAAFGFVGFEAEKTTPPQSSGCNVRFPGASLAASDLGVSRGHLHRVLTGERKSPPLLARWSEWLATRPEFARLQSR